MEQEEQEHQIVLVDHLLLTQDWRIWRIFRWISTNSCFGRRRYQVMVAMEED
jgi:hypothetical protein